MTKRILHWSTLLFSFAITLWAADDPIVGTWKLNLAKSNQVATNSFQAAIASIEARHGGIKNTADIISAHGEKIHLEATVKYNGKDYPVNGDPYTDTVAIKRLDARHADSILKKNGRVVGTVQNVISPDGKTWTAITTGKDEAGRDVTIVAVYDKQ
jgi:uncharacterized protein (DUF2147 family)